MMGFVLIVVIATCWMGLRPKEGNFSADPFVLASALGVSVIRNAQFNFSNLLSDWKQKGLFKRFHTFLLPQGWLLFGLVSFSWMMNLVISGLIFAIGLIFPQQQHIIIYTNWWIFLSGWFLHLLLATILAIVVQPWIKSANLKRLICLVSWFLGLYLLGLGIPLNVTGQVKWLNFLTYLIPYRYSLALIQSGFIWKAVPNLALPIRNASFFPNTNIQIPGGVPKESFLAHYGFGFANQLWLPYLILLILFGVFLILIVIGYRRDYLFNLYQFQNYPGMQIHMNNISQIKMAQNHSQLQKVIQNRKHQ